jgi:predicted dehydrogenase
VMDLHALTVTVFNRGNGTPDVQRFTGFERNQLFIDELNHFLECVKARKRPVIDLNDGLQSLRMALAVKMSIATHQPVELASIE